MATISKKATMADVKRYYTDDQYRDFDARKNFITVSDIFKVKNGKLLLVKYPDGQLKLQKRYKTLPYAQRPQVIYWLRYDHHTDPKKEGYIGMASANSLCRRMGYHKLNGNPSVQRKMRSGNVTIEVLHITPNRKQADDIEKEYRPTPNIGWNMNKRQEIEKSFDIFKAITRGKETFSGYNKPKRTPKHPTKSHAVLAKKGEDTKLIRFGQKGVSGEGKPSKSDTKAEKARRASFKARHAKNIKRGKMSAAYWADRVKW